MFVVGAAVAAVLGVVCLVVAVAGIRGGAFPFRPRRSGTAPDGDRHALRLADEPVQFWVVASGLLGVGVLMVVTTGMLVVRLYRGEP